MANTSMTEERRRDDRRRRAAALSRQFWAGGRRRRFRREADGPSGYVDVYEWRLGLAVIAIAMASILDAAFTLTLLNHGAMEANPVMAAALAFGPAPFVATKLIITGAALMVLLVHQRWWLFGSLSVRRVIAAMGLIYAAVLAWEFWIASVLEVSLLTAMPT